MACNSRIPYYWNWQLIMCRYRNQLFITWKRGEFFCLTENIQIIQGCKRMQGSIKIRSPITIVLTKNSYMTRILYVAKLAKKTCNYQAFAYRVLWMKTMTKLLKQWKKGGAEGILIKQNDEKCFNTIISYYFSIEMKRYAGDTVQTIK